MPVPARLHAYLFAAVACLGLAAFAAYDLYRERERSIAQTRANTANLAQLLEEHARQSMRRIESVLTDAEARIGDISAPQSSAAAALELQRELQAVLPADGLLGAMVWQDAEGLQLQSTAQPGRAPLGDKAALQALLQKVRDAPGNTLSFGRLVPDRGELGVRWLLPVGRRMQGSNARPASLVALVDLRTLQPVLDAVDTGRNGFVTLFMNDGWMLATAPQNDQFLSRNWFETPMFKEHLPRGRVGTVQQVVVRDGTERVYSYRALAEYPLVVSIGVSLTDALADWRARVGWDLLLLAIVSSAAFLAASVMARSYARREAAEQASAQAARQTQAIVDHAADGIVTYDDQGHIASVNHACLAMFGHSAAALAGQPVTWLLPGLGSMPAGGAAAQAAAKVAASDGRVQSVGRREDGSEFPIELALTELPSADHKLHIALIRDVTERLKSQAALSDARDEAQRSERFLRTITDKLPLRISYVDRSLRYRFVNQAHLERFKLPRQAVVGRSRQEITGDPPDPELLQHLDAVLQGQEQRFEIRDSVSTAPGTVMEVFLVPDIGPSGTVEGFYAASTDVTERHAQQHRLKQALAERETLLREVYHRVKNNLQVIQSLLNLQRRALPEGPARAALGDSVLRVQAMSLVHEKLYQTDRLDAVSLREYTTELLRHLGDTAGAARRGIELHAVVDPIEASLEAAVPFGMLVTELVSNSLKHGFPAARFGKIEVSLKREGNSVWLRVHDNGVGLPAGFEPEQTTSMGLQLASGLAKQLGGQLLAHNDEGAHFSVQCSRML